MKRNAGARVVRLAAVLAAALLTLRAARQRPDTITYRAVVEQFATQPRHAADALLAIPRDELANAVHEAVRPDSGWTVEEIDRALLMHGEAGLALLPKQPEAALRQLSLGDDLATAAAAKPGNAWFVHRWYTAVTGRAGAPLPPLEEHWHRQPWYRDAVEIDKGRELEQSAGKRDTRTDVPVFDVPDLRLAIGHFERGVAGHFAVAALHFGRVRMLLGDDTEARRLFGIAADDTQSRVNRYLAHLFLGSLAERDGILDVAEDHYRKALVALPRAQSGRVALAAVLARRDHDDDARAAIVAAGPPPYDPWWSYLRGTAQDYSFILAELHSEVSR